MFTVVVFFKKLQNNQEKTQNSTEKDLFSAVNAWVFSLEVVCYKRYFSIIVAF
jgi:hypothetical protein